MAVVNSGDPVNTLRDALDAYTSVQQTMIDEAAKLKDPPAMGGASEPAHPTEGATGAVPAQY